MTKMSSIPDGCSECDSNTKHRVVTKQGTFRVKLDSGKSVIISHYLKDALTTLVDAKWRWSFLIFVMGFLLTWLVFALLYYGFSIAHNNPEIISLGDDSDDIPCISNVFDFTSAFLFSIETQHTIGYGFRGVTSECPHVILTVFFQFIIGIAVHCLTAALVFTKLQRSKRRGETVVFSHKACIGVVDGQWRLMIRVGDFRRSQLLEPKATGIMVRRSANNEGKEYLQQNFIEFKSEGGGDILTLLWPAVMYHTIDVNSPLWPPEKLDEFGGFSELVVLLEGVIESTSMTVQVRTSYIPEEIHFGYKFQTICPQVQENDKYQCSYFDFNTIIPINHRRKVSHYSQQGHRRQPRPIKEYN